MNYEVCPFSYWLTKPASKRDDAVEAARRGEFVWEPAGDVHHCDGVLIKVGCLFVVTILNGEQTWAFGLMTDADGGAAALLDATVGEGLGADSPSVFCTPDEWPAHRDEWRKKWLNYLPTHPKGGPREAVVSLLKWTFPKKEIV